MVKLQLKLLPDYKIFFFERRAIDWTIFLVVLLWSMQLLLLESFLLVVIGNDFESYLVFHILGLKDKLKDIHFHHNQIHIKIN